MTILWLTLALYTKESALAIYGTIGLIELIRSYQDSRSILSSIKNSLYLLVPFVAIAVFFVAQKKIVGWVFFPDHLDKISLSEFKDKLDLYTEFLFFSMGRSLLTILGVIAFVWLFIYSRERLRSKSSQILLCAIFVLVYGIFSSLNFFTYRYLLSSIPFFILLATYLIDSAASQQSKQLAFIPPLLIAGLSLHFTLRSNLPSDVSLGYKDLVKVQKEIVEYCEAEQLHEEQILANFLMVYYLKNADLGYLGSDQSFKHVHTKLDQPWSYSIFSSEDLNHENYSFYQENADLIKRSESGNSWCELYRITSDD